MDLCQRFPPGNEGSAWILGQERRSESPFSAFGSPDRFGGEIRGRVAVPQQPWRPWRPSRPWRPVAERCLYSIGLDLDRFGSLFPISCKWPATYLPSIHEWPASYRPPLPPLAARAATPTTALPHGCGATATLDRYSAPLAALESSVSRTAQNTRLSLVLRAQTVHFFSRQALGQPQGNMAYSKEVKG